MTRLLISLTVAALLLGGCTSSKKTGDPAEPAFSVQLFTALSALVTNPYFPLVPGTTHVFTEESEDGTELTVVEVLDQTRIVAGIECRVVRDRVFLDELILEDTHDWYAQDRDGNVWYMGESVVNYEYDDDGNLLGTNNDSAWESGVDGALPGILMKATLVIGDKYQQENRPGVAEDAGEIVALDVLVTLADGSSHRCLQTRDTNPLEPGVVEFKYYARGIGQVAGEAADGSDRAELRGRFDPLAAALPDFAAAAFSNPTSVTNRFWPLVPGTTRTFVDQGEDEIEVIVVSVLDETRVVNGVECVVVRDRVYIDELLVEDTHDWFAQDDAGNVWYMGEEVVNYEYDDEGNLIGTNPGGSWEAGVDGAQAGIQMWASPTVGQNYYQEYYEGEAVDVGYVAATGLTVQGPNGTTYTGCVQIFERTALEPESAEYKYYAPNVGVVREHKVPLEDNAPIHVVGEFLTTPASLPDFGAAAFSNPTALTNQYFPFSFGTTYALEKQTEDGLEIIQIEVEAATRVVNGVECLAIRDRVFLDGVLIEDTFDWFAQDDAGNVWYMGEDSTSFEYDDDGNLVETSTEGSWEAGVDGAQAGILMWANPILGLSHYQEFYEGEAEDMGVTVQIGITITVDGATYQDCIKVLEWTPLDPGGLEYKYYAPGIGIVLEESLLGEEPAERINE